MHAGNFGTLLLSVTDLAQIANMQFNIIGKGQYSARSEQYHASDADEDLSKFRKKDKLLH